MCIRDRSATCCSGGVGRVGEGVAMLRRLGIRGKILAVLAVPLLVLFTAAGILSAQAWDQSRRAAAVQTLLTALGDSRELVGALQVERDTSAVSVDPYPSHRVVNVAD